MHNGSVHTYVFLINSAVLVLRVRLCRWPSRRMQWRMSPTRLWTYSGIYGEPTCSAGWSVFLTFIAMFSLLFTAAHSIVTCSFSSSLLLLFAHAGSLYSSPHSPENDTLCSSYNHKRTLCHPSHHHLWLFPLTGCIASFRAHLFLVFYRFLSCCVVFPVRAAARRCLCSTKWVSWTWSSSVWRDTRRTWNWPYLLVGRINILLTVCLDYFNGFWILKRFLCSLKSLDAVYIWRNSLVALVEIFLKG